MMVGCGPRVMFMSPPVHKMCVFTAAASVCVSMRGAGGPAARVPELST